MVERALVFTSMRYAVWFGAEYSIFICNNMLVLGWKSVDFEDAVKPWISSNLFITVIYVLYDLLNLFFFLIR